MIVFTLLAITVAYRDQVWLDRFLPFEPARNAGFFAPEKAGVLQIALLLRLLFGWPTLGLVTALVLASGFFSGRLITTLQLLFGPLPAMKVANPRMLFAGEMLTGALLAIWLCGLLVTLIHRHGPSDDLLSFPSWVPLKAVVFWGTLAITSWQLRWNRRVAVALSAWFLTSVLFAIFSVVYLGYAWPTDIVGAILLGGALLCVSHSCVERFAT